jgi:hypothetical protein
VGISIGRRRRTGLVFGAEHRPRLDRLHQAGRMRRLVLPWTRRYGPELRLRIIIEQPPPGVDFGMQKGNGDAYETVQTQRSGGGDLVLNSSYKGSDSDTLGSVVPAPVLFSNGTGFAPPTNASNGRGQYAPPSWSPRDRQSLEVDSYSL